MSNFVTIATPEFAAYRAPRVPSVDLVEALPSAGIAALVALKRTVGTIADAFAREVNIHHTVKALSALDDRMLRDIGVSRAEIDEFVRARV